MASTLILKMLKAAHKDGCTFHFRDRSSGTFTSNMYPGKAADWRVFGAKLTVENESKAVISYADARDFAIAQLRVVNHSQVIFTMPSAQKLLGDLYFAAQMFKFLATKSENDLHALSAEKFTKSVQNKDGSWKS